MTEIANNGRDPSTAFMVVEALPNEVAIILMRPTGGLAGAAEGTNAFGLFDPLKGEHGEQRSFDHLHYLR